jgi:predicted acetyltransferase
VHDQVKIAKDRVDQIQSEIDNLGHSDNLMLQEKNAQVILEQKPRMMRSFFGNKNLKSNGIVMVSETQPISIG